MNKNVHFVKENYCPYCTYPVLPQDPYPCDSASEIMGNRKPRIGDLSFCLMCCNTMEFDKNMKLIKFDLNSIDDLIQRNRIKLLRLNIKSFLEYHPDKDGRREKYLKIMDEKDIKND